MAPLNDDCWPLKNISVLSNRGCNSRTYTEGIIHYYKNLVAASYYDIRLWREVRSGSVVLVRITKALVYWVCIFGKGLNIFIENRHLYVMYLEV